MKSCTATFFRMGLAALWLFSTMAGSETLAQQSPTEPKQQPGVEDVGSSKVPEWEVGPILIDPRLVMTEIYDDNIFATRNDKVDDFITIASPAVTLSVEKEAFDLTFDAGAEIARYASRQREDYNDYWVNADGIVSLDGGTDIFAGASYAYDHEDRESPDDVNGREPTTFRRVTAILGGLQRFDACLFASAAPSIVSTSTTRLRKAVRSTTTTGIVSSTRPGCGRATTPRQDSSPLFRAPSMVETMTAKRTISVSSGTPSDSMRQRA